MVLSGSHSPVHSLTDHSHTEVANVNLNLNDVQEDHRRRVLLASPISVCSFSRSPKRFFLVWPKPSPRAQYSPIVWVSIDRLVGRDMDNDDAELSSVFFGVEDGHIDVGRIQSSKRTTTWRLDDWMVIVHLNFVIILGFGMHQAHHHSLPYRMESNSQLNVQLSWTKKKTIHFSHIHIESNHQEFRGKTNNTFQSWKTK